MIEIGKGGARDLQDYHLSRFACYLIAQNGDSRKSEIANAQKYFAIQTRRQELSDDMAADLERLETRKQTITNSRSSGRFTSTYHESRPVSVSDEPSGSGVSDADRWPGLSSPNRRFFRAARTTSQWSRKGQRLEGWRHLGSSGDTETSSWWQMNSSGISSSY